MSKAEPLVAEGARLSLQADPKDNVATLLDEQLECSKIASGLSIDRGIPFGHKVALRQIGAGDAVVKYGVTIGYAVAAIREGEHVHVHNIA